MFGIFITILSVTCTYGYNIVPKDMKIFKKPLYFFPAHLKNSLPQELYHTFIDHLKEDYDVKIDIKEIELSESNPFNQEILLMSHSSGANQLMDVYEKLNETVHTKAILIDPLDFKKYSLSEVSISIIPEIPSIPNLDEIDQSLKDIFEKDYIEEIKTYIFKNDIKNETTSKNKILVLSHINSENWRIFPFIPPIHVLKMEFDSLNNTTIIEKNIDEEFSHFDILDRPWANGINKLFFLNKKKDKSSYFDEIFPLIREFYNKV